LHTDLLNDPHRTAEDIRLVNRAVRNRWGIKPTERAEVVERLMRVVRKESVTAMNKQGEAVELDGPADAAAVQAAKVIVAMEGQNQSDEHLDIKNGRLDEGKPTEMYKVYGGFDPGSV
jgi:hypothetical protein